MFSIVFDAIRLFLGDFCSVTSSSFVNMNGGRLLLW